MQLCEKLCRKFHEHDGRTNKHTKGRTERRKLYTPRHKCQGYNNGRSFEEIMHIYICLPYRSDIYI